MTTVDFTKSYRARKKRAMIVLSIFALLILLTFIVSMNTGFIKLTPYELLKTIMGHGTAQQELILFEFRLPRIVISIIVGASLAVSGCVMQGFSRNALADPGILGINAGAGLAVIVYISFIPIESTSSVMLLPVLAWLGAGATAAIIYALAYKRNDGLSPTRLLLTGIAIAAAISAAMIVLTLKLSPEQYNFVAKWMAGSIWGSNWKYVASILPFFIVLLPYVIYKSHILNILNMGDQLSTGLGVDVEKQRRMLLAAAVGLAGSAVSISGGIGFVGLIAPHLVRRLIGPQHQFLLPGSALAGGLLVLVADTLGRWMIQPSEIPAGIIVACIGAPYFLYLLAKSK
ncbi:FecCD family ABC transporter permease [Kurthia sibirica]|uniref:Iron ABC transporter permease n=1 Tax=Kurthia sibirica TaxID=202750 RepID=A0A2U3AQC5_9BACL|nr:iron ABC transporter permease [Kurthia sibirica]PWI26655.1 iron ABC transporter permease [Kurthia sibirica]GEK32918.1 iron ABC transporter permease [Kurthia sibirica]